MSGHSHRTPDGFAAQAREALGDRTLTQAMRRVTDLFAERRAAALETVPDWQELRQQARAIKLHTLARLDHYLAQFAGAAAKNGAIVHWAEDAAAACRIVGELAQVHRATRLVKSKSMATEEIHLNAALAAAGTEPVETDLGEWIIQLAGEMPSHIIVPAIHKTRQQISELFVDKLGVAPSDEPTVLAAEARERLRQHFAEADMGISGVNFGVAETGTILVLENEGNARMTTTLPKVHVAVMGIEKVIPRFADLEVFLRLLPRSGTGQHLTSYQSLLTGPDVGVPGRAGQGPRELHLVLLDNGRANIAVDETMRETLACIRCGACLNACPVYQSVGGHAYGAVYPGPIGAILTPQLQGMHQAAALPFASSLCGACKDVCPVQIDIPSLLLELRKRAVEGEAPGAAPAKRAAFEALTWKLWAWFVRSPGRYRFAAAMARLGDKLPLVKRLLPPMRAWASSRALPRLAKRPFRAGHKDGGS
ncbi:MAG: iron-sulfur cluster-binding protein [Planctomycetes bacterium]|nr:iron-sulfur cluster-binding protein [Planctomycetota bacterium]